MKTKSEPLSVKVRHWPNGYQHDHVGIHALDALAHALRCSGHRHGLAELRDVVHRLETSGRYDHPSAGIFRLVPRGSDW